jgi:hypothetical protein
MHYTATFLLTNPCKIAYFNNPNIQTIFNEEEMPFIKMFWHQEFDTTWIILDELFIKKWLNNQRYEEILSQMFNYDIDYKTIDDKYIIKGECLKHLCILSNYFFRHFFIKFGNLSRLLLISDITVHKQLDKICQKIDNITFHVNEILSERIEELTKHDTRCEEVMNIIKLPYPNNTPVHLLNAKYVVIRCLRKNYKKNLNKIKSCDMEEMFDTPILSKGLNIIKELKQRGFKTLKNNAFFSDNHLELVDSIKVIIAQSLEEPQD